MRTDEQVERIINRSRSTLASRLPRGWLLAAAAFCTASLAAGTAAIDSDGDGLPDDRDPLPALATVPLHWSVQAVMVAWEGLSGTPDPAAAWNRADALLIASTRERGDIPGSRPGACATASPLDARAGTSPPDNGIDALSVFGTGEMIWSPQQRLRVRRFAENPAGAGRGVVLVFEMHFRVFSSEAIRLGQLRIPVLLDGRRVAMARPADPGHAERGLVLPGGKPRQVFVVPFQAVVSPRKVKAALRAMEEASPVLQFDRAEGLCNPPGHDGTLAVADWFKGIRERTAEVKLRGGDGQVLAWRVARRLAGAPQTVRDWAETVNALAQQHFGSPFWIEEAGFLTSLAGWDTGAWDRWWRLEGRRAAGTDWLDTRLDRGVTLTLGDAPPAWSARERQRLAEVATENPRLLCLQARQAWLDGREADAVAAYRLAADRNYAPGLNWFGFCQAEGRGVERDLARAVTAYQAAAKQNYAPGEAWLGGCHLRGNGVPVNRESAFAWLGKAAAQGHPEGTAVHALCLTRGLGVPADPAKGLLATRRAAWLDSPIGQLALGMQLLDAGNPAGVDWLLCAAESGDARAQTRLARCLAEGEGIAANPKAAAAWYGRAAAQGDAAAQLALGRVLRAGHGVRRDAAQAAHWFEQAAGQGNREAQTWLGLMLLDGEGVARDPAAGVGWIRQAAEQGHAQAQYLLGLTLYAGLGGMEAAPAEALKWFQAAADQQILPARIFHGFSLYSGRGAAQDRVAAFRQFQMAAEQGSAIGQIWLAHCYAFGEGVEVDLTQAREWAQKAWRQGHPGGRAMLRRIPRE